MWLLGATEDERGRIEEVLSAECAVESFECPGAMLERLSARVVPDVVLVASAGQQAPGLCRQLRAHHDDLTLPILVVGTGCAEDAIAAGANDCIGWPSEEWSLRARVRTLAQGGRLARLENGRLSTLFEQAPAFMAHVSGPEHVFDMANEAYVRLVGERALIGKRVRDALPELEGQGFFELLDRVFESGEPFVARETVVRLVQPDVGEHREAFVNFIFQPTRGADGEVNGILALGFEVTELVRAREQAFAAERAQAALLEAVGAQSLVFVALLRGPSLVFEMANGPYAALFGGRKLVGKPLLEAAPELRGQGFDLILERVMQTGEPFVGREVPVKLARPSDGMLEEALVSFVYQPIRGVRGGFDGVFVAGIEVTGEVRTRQEVQQRLDFEQQLVGIVAHDLRSPLAAVRMSASQLMPGGGLHADLSEQQVRAVERVDRGARRIQSVLASLLDLTRARGEHGIPVAPAPADLDATARQVIDEVRTAHPGRTVEYLHRGDTRAIFDAERLAQVVANLLENAFKYGTVEAPVQVVCEGDGGTVRLQVHNRGSPIPQDLVARLFQPFARGPQTSDTVRVSMGLGLFIVREIVRAHGGTVSVSSSEEEGTRFVVELPRAGATAAAGEPSAAQPP